MCGPVRRRIETNWKIEGHQTPEHEVDIVGALRQVFDPSERASDRDRRANSRKSHLNIDQLGLARPKPPGTESELY